MEEHLLLPVVGVFEVANTAIEEHADIEAAIAEYDYNSANVQLKLASVELLFTLDVGLQVIRIWAHVSIDKESKVDPLVDVADDGWQNEHIHQEGEDRHLALFVSMPRVRLICKTVWTYQCPREITASTYKKLCN